MKVDLEKDILPPEELIMDGSPTQNDYVKHGALVRKLFESHLELHEDQHVLEIGSAIGRIARQFLNHLSDKGSYTGVEIMPAVVQWCAENITPRFSNFRFIHADIYNSHYNPHGTMKASSYVFPLADESFDLVLLTSVFTHMLHSDISNYLREIKRMLRDNAVCLATFFVFEKEEFKEIYAEHTNPRFLFPVYMRKTLPVCVCADAHELEVAVAYEKNFMEEKISEAGLEIHKYLTGGWLKSRTDTFYPQDIYILRK